jgi:hypothetical protein
MPSSKKLILGVTNKLKKESYLPGTACSKINEQGLQLVHSLEK